jgi:hypothetical protein
MTRYCKCFSFLFFAGVSILLALSWVLSGTAGNSNTPAQDSPNPAAGSVKKYKEFCGQCHLAYPPEFLPSASWERLLGATDDHFGEPLHLDPETKTLLASYLAANGAERSESKKARKILESLNGKSPLRLTEVPYLVSKHGKISLEVLKRPSIGALSHCQACHLSAEKGIFNSKAVIPD